MHERRGAPATPCRAESSFLSSLSQLFSRGFSEMRRRGGDPSRPAPLHALSIRPSSLLARGRGGRMRGGGAGQGAARDSPLRAPPTRLGPHPRDWWAPARPDDVGGNHSYFVCFLLNLAQTQPSGSFLRSPLSWAPVAASANKARFPRSRGGEKGVGPEGQPPGVHPRPEVSPQSMEVRPCPELARVRGAGDPSPGSVSRLSDGQGLPGGPTPLRGQQGRGLRHSLRARLHPALALPCPSQPEQSRAAGSPG